MGFDFDVAIVGGGPAGTVTALALLEDNPQLAGRAVVLEKARYPRDKPCAGAIGARGDVLLDALSVRVDVPSVPVDGVSFRSRAGEATASPGRIGRVVRRIEFDHALAKAAASRGATVRDGVRVDAVDDGPEGVTLRTNAGLVRARAVVGCDGVGSIVRKGMGAGLGAYRAQVIEVDTEPVAGDRDRKLLHFDTSDPRLSGYAWDFPTVVEGRPLVCRGIYRLKRAEDDDRGLPDIGALLSERLRALGVDPACCERKRYAERGFDASSPLAQGARMLVGEAAGIDAATGEGIAQAIEYGTIAGRFLARALATSPRGRVALEGWDAEIRRSRLARDLRMRTHLMRLFYGSRRREVERFFAQSPEALRVGCKHFAAHRQDWLEVGGVLARSLATVAAISVSGLLDS